MNPKLVKWLYCSCACGELTLSGERWAGGEIEEGVLRSPCGLEFPIHFIYCIPVIGHIGLAFFVIPMLPDWRWRVLDTFDWYSVRYQPERSP